MKIRQEILSKNWEIKKLGEIGLVFNGNSINERVKRIKYTGLGEGMPFIATKDINYENIIEYENGVKIPAEEQSNFKIAPAETPLICAEGGSAGRKIGFTKQDVCFGNKLFALVPNRNVDSKYVYYYYFTNSFKNHFSSELTGIIGGVSMNKFKDIPIPLPPLPEQKRIVAILDKCFAAIDKAKANTEKNLRNARELFESFLEGVFEKRGEGWVEKRLGEVCEFENGDRGKNYPNKSHRVVNGIPFINAGHLNNCRIDYSEMDFISEERFKLLGNGKVRPNDIIFCLRGSLGKVANVGSLKKAAIASSLVIIRARNQLDQDFLLHFLNSSLTTKQIAEFGNGAAQPNLSAGSLKMFKISFPQNRVHQQSIVRQLDTLRAETQKLEAVYTKKLADLDELKKSILQKAFSGELKVNVKLGYE